MYIDGQMYVVLFILLIEATSANRTTVSKIMYVSVNHTIVQNANYP